MTTAELSAILEYSIKIQNAFRAQKLITYCNDGRRALLIRQSYETAIR